MALSRPRVSLLSSAGLLACAALLAGAPAPSQDPLWQKAVEGAERAAAAGIVPGRLEMNATVKKPNGTVEEQSAMLFRIVYEGEESRTEVISATENGKDVTEKVRAAEAEQERERKGKKTKDDDSVSLELEPGYHPFSQEIQRRVTCKRTGEVSLEQRKAALFTFRHSSEDGKTALEGKAWLDPETGAPLQVEASPDPHPKHVDTLKSTIRFEATPDGLWRPVTSEIRGEGGMLWIRRVFESSFRFSGWHSKGKNP